MQVIPVIDLVNSQVVHAQQGKRDTYQPIQSPLVSSADPYAVVDAMLDYFPFKTLYIADLNSIQQKAIDAQHYALIKALCKRYPSVTFWVDAGVLSHQQFSHWSMLPVKSVLGSESMTCFEEYLNTMQQMPKPEILSLDFIDDAFIGNQELLSQPQVWPETVITMTLDSVGAKNGPNWRKLQEIKALNQHATLVAAGGIRDIKDLIQLSADGVDGALVATALHHKQLSPQDLSAL